ncbi:ABC transporter permease [Rhizobium sp. VS19-DR104.2]|uniref:ABC transporter permease n=1 Tax=unclassified Rhizobium TaxID=2613769 RepID=UPI001CC74F0E|nr:MULTISPECIES: ABC transporter permease [unclassified Rhizobium]MBZ5761971.1 ABC transporter permease [Rhizobium sp. VS19-DR96]MBZ5768383.1 ABC transporter permease [Rhizobium sp. VS19-DR129.2]MBZ5775653.1 ABC transporter permease [Rhizobium sp. VS19-DRK62.2]MBZ5786849.1 ABC transporter permease [Rhizobium sp. VS19-DR121]MBZ5804419.1 ABC transporter permease [Rhizobium sp. VS19-DR181]
MNPHAPAAVSLVSLFKSLWINRELILRLTKRDVIGRYRGSAMGLLWSFINPLALLVVYTFVFSVVFKARWGVDQEPRAQFAVVLFSGMIIHSLFSETLIRAPSLMISNVSYVKKIVFPLEILPVVAIGASCFHAVISIFVLICAILFLDGSLSWTVLFMPLILLPMVLFSLGAAWILASVGVYLRDVGQPIGLCMTILLFASPVFYPISALPAEYRPWLNLNPLTFIIEQTRAVLIYGQMPVFSGLALYALISLIVLWTGYAWFQKTRKGFANVL